MQLVGRNLLNREVGRIIRWGYLVQQQGIIALESDAKTVRGDEFLNFGVEMAVSSYPGEDVREILLNTAARASSIVRYFISLSLNSSRLSASGYADTKPKLPNSDLTGNVLKQNQAENRRVVLRLHP